MAARPAGLERTAANFLHTSNLVTKYRGCSKLNAFAAAAAAAHAAYYRVPEKTPLLQDDWRICDGVPPRGCAFVCGVPRGVRAQDANQQWRHTFAVAASLLLLLLLPALLSAPLQEPDAVASPKRRGCEARPANRRRDDINKNIKRRRLLFDCCVHLYTRLHHYGLFSLQIKPESVQISRRLKSF